MRTNWGGAHKLASLPYVDISSEEKTTFSPAELTEADRERMSTMSNQSSPSESCRSEYLGLTGEDAHELGTINPR